MPITSIESDPSSLTLTAVGEYPVPIERLWRAWEDPRQLERFWGPPPWPATFTRHDMSTGGRSAYFMTGPKGETSHGWWEFVSVEPGRSFVVRDGFAAEDGTPNDALPSSTMKVSFETTRTGSRFVAVSRFQTMEAMEQVLAMGVVEGLRTALAQMDEVLADLREFSRGVTDLEKQGDVHAITRREVRGTIQQVWRAHHEPALLRQWLLGPEGWTMPVCVVAEGVGGTYRYEWENTADGNRFGFEGQVLEQEPPRREVTTERMLGMPGAGTVNELTLTPRPGARTLIAIQITYPSAELREMILGSGMVDGMEASYARLDGLLQDIAG